MCRIAELPRGESRPATWTTGMRAGLTNCQGFGGVRQTDVVRHAAGMDAKHERSGLSLWVLDQLGEHHPEAYAFWMLCEPKPVQSRVWEENDGR